MGVVTAEKLAPVLKYPGAKWRIADWILAHMPPHESYLEPFFGSGAVFFKKLPAQLETINDLDGDVVNLFRCLRDSAARAALIEAVAFTPYARSEHTDCWEARHVGEPVEDARRFLVRIWMNHGMRMRGKGGWAHVTRRSSAAGGGFASRVVGWNALPERMAWAALRLKDAHVENRPALDVIRRHADPGCLIYADPPYVHSTRSSVVSERHRQYAHEMADGEHAELLAALVEHPGPVLLSGYPHPLYDETLVGWSRFAKGARAEKGKVREEVLWVNPAAAAAQEGRLPF